MGRCTTHHRPNPNKCLKLCCIVSQWMSLESRRAKPWSLGTALFQFSSWIFNSWNELLQDKPPISSQSFFKRLPLCGWSKKCSSKISCTKFIHKWPTSFTKTNKSVTLVSSSFGHHCFLHQNNPAWLWTASAKAADNPNGCPRFQKLIGSFHTLLLKRHWYLSCSTWILSNWTRTLTFARESTVIRWSSTPNVCPQIQPHHPSAKSQPAPLVPCFALDHRHRPGLRVANGGHVSCCAQHVAEHVLEEEVCLCPTFLKHPKIKIEWERSYVSSHWKTPCRMKLFHYIPVYCAPLASSPGVSINSHKEKSHKQNIQSISRHPGPLCEPSFGTTFVVSRVWEQCLEETKCIKPRAFGVTSVSGRCFCHCFESVSLACSGIVIDW